MNTPPSSLDLPDEDSPRVASWNFDASGRLRHQWNLTSSGLAGTVRLNLGPPYVLPVIFVPGIMGSNLKVKPPTDAADTDTDPVWRLDMSLAGYVPLDLVKNVVLDAGIRQRLLHPDRVTVDDRGAVPGRTTGSISSLFVLDSAGRTVNAYADRGWGEVGEGSYHGFLLWLEKALNGRGWDPMKWQDFYPTDSMSGPASPPAQPRVPYPPHIAMKVRGMSDEGAERNGKVSPLTFGELQKRAQFWMPVHAFGYNWLASNERAAQLLAKRIEQVRKRYGDRCGQVILVTHSMGGLVARRCQQLPGMSEKIAGVLHGVMPALGAPVAYRRCKLGMADEASGIQGSIASHVIGNNGREITAVFAQAPGALELLPTEDYPSGWLQLREGQDKAPILALPKANDPYTDIYLRRDRWWGLVREAWLAPEDGQPITWGNYEKNIETARLFHAATRRQYHPATYVFYGADEDQRSFANIVWRMRPGIAPNGSPRPSAANVAELGMGDTRDEGRNPVYVGGATEWSLPFALAGSAMHVPHLVETSHWELHADKQDAIGDGTVPPRSGNAPLASYAMGQVIEQVRLAGFDHEGSYKNENVRSFSLYAIIKIAANARKPS